MIKSTKRGPNFAQFTLLSIGVVLIKNTLGLLGIKKFTWFLQYFGQIEVPQIGWVFQLQIYYSFRIWKSMQHRVNPGRTIWPKMDWCLFKTFQISLFREFFHHKTFFGGRQWSYPPIQWLDLVLIEPILH
jgi:hypothetical protein